MVSHEQVNMLHRPPWQWSGSSCHESEASTARGLHTTDQVPRMLRSLTRAAVLRCVVYCAVLSCTCVVYRGNSSEQYTKPEKSESQSTDAVSKAVAAYPRPVVLLHTLLPCAVQARCLAPAWLQLSAPLSAAVTPMPQLHSLLSC